MKKKILSLLLAAAMVVSMAACGESGNSGTAPEQPAEQTETKEEVKEEAKEETKEEPAAEEPAAEPSELTDGKFAETRKITVEVYDRGNDGGSDPENNMYTDYIKKGTLE